MPSLGPEFTGKLWPHYHRKEAVCDPDLRQLTSEHEGADHPGWGCSCGIWARSEEDPPERRSPVWGEVSLWGKVIRYSKGYRAQYAYPKRLYVDAFAGHWSLAQAQRLADRLAAAYGVPCGLNVRDHSPAPTMTTVLWKVWFD